MSINLAKLNPDVEKAVENIMDIFTGADGGGDFYRVLVMLDGIQKKANEGDKSAQKLTQEFVHFSNLLNLMKRGL